MVWTFNGTTLTGTGSLSPTTVSGVLEQNGQVLRTITGRAVRNLVWSKWAYTFSWTQAPESIVAKLQGMVEDAGTITFTDATMGNYSFVLTDDGLQIDDTKYGAVNAVATFREV